MSVPFPKINFQPSFLSVGGSARHTDASRPPTHPVPQCLLIAKGAGSDTPGNDTRAPVPTPESLEGSPLKKIIRYHPPRESPTVPDLHLSSGRVESLKPIGVTLRCANRGSLLRVLSAAPCPQPPRHRDSNMSLSLSHVLLAQGLHPRIALFSQGCGPEGLEEAKWGPVFTLLL